MGVTGEQPGGSDTTYQNGTYVRICIDLPTLYGTNFIKTYPLCDYFYPKISAQKTLQFLS